MCGIYRNLCKSIFVCAVYLAAILTVCNASSSNLLNKHLNYYESSGSFPKFLGAKLVGIFEDSPEENIETPTEAFKETYANFFPLIDYKTLYYCKEENFSVNSVEDRSYTSPEKCLLSPVNESLFFDPETSSNYISETNFFIIPSNGAENETIADTSYIHVQVRVCAKPGSQVLVVDTVSGKILYGFANAGAAYHCNHWVLQDSQEFISNSNQIRVEYSVLASINSTKHTSVKYINSKQKQGMRSIVVKSEQMYNFFDMTVTYEEVPFIYTDPIVLDPNDYNWTNGGELPLIETDYKPNSVLTYILNKHSLCDQFISEKCNEINIGVFVDVNYLNLDFDRGDYLLIGAGNKPIFWKNSKSEIISHKIVDPSERRKVWINADSAFVRLVTHGFFKQPQKALEFTWAPANTTIDNSNNKGIAPRLKAASIQLCFNDMGCMAWENTVKLDFINEFVHLLNKHLIDEEKNVTILVNHESVVIYDEEETNHVYTQHTNKFCQINIAVASPYDNEYPLVERSSLNKMFFDNSESRWIHNSQVLVTNCNYQTITYWKIIIPILIIMFTSFLILTIFWRIQNKVIKKNQSQKNELSERLRSGSIQNDDPYY